MKTDTYLYKYIWGCPINCADWCKSSKTGFDTLYTVHGSIAHKAAAWLLSWPAQRIAFQLKFNRNRVFRHIADFASNESSTKGKLIGNDAFQKQVLANKIPTDDVACLQAGWLALLLPSIKF